MHPRKVAKYISVDFAKDIVSDDPKKGAWSISALVRSDRNEVTFDLAAFDNAADGRTALERIRP